ncbi:MAG: serine/threonine protein kinase [Deltaproteobacteria bacterium]|nr:MAG: serine/threonine protein kinase [Deltaproteobacteria bacterium]
MGELFGFWDVEWTSRRLSFQAGVCKIFVLCPSHEDQALKRSLDDLAGLVVGGKYRLETLIGEGGMAYVYKGVHKDFNHPIAFKVLFSHLAKKHEVRERFKREARLQFRLQHPNIVRVIDMIEEDNMLGIVLDWVEGQDLEHYLKEIGRPVSLEEVRRIFVPILTAVGYAHDEGIVHRDLKPSNVLLEGKPGREVPKVMDFGIAKSLGDDNFKTRTGMMVGTPYYISPEQSQASKEVDHRTDIYSLGVTLFQMLTGKVPYEGTNALEVLAQHCFHEVPNLANIRQDVPPRLGEIVQQAMAKDPINRFKSARTFARELLPLLPTIKSVDVSQDELDAVSNPRTSPDMTALGAPPVPQGWQSPGVTVATPVPPTKLPSSDKTQFSWEYESSAEHPQASGSSFPIMQAPQHPLPSGEIWNPQHPHPHSGSYPPASSGSYPPATSGAYPPAPSGPYTPPSGPYTPVPSGAYSFEGPSSVTPPYSRPIALANPDRSIPLGHPPASYGSEDFPTQDDLSIKSAQSKLQTPAVLWSIVVVLVLVLTGGVLAMYRSLRPNAKPAASPGGVRSGGGTKSAESPPPRVEIVVVDTTADAGSAQPQPRPNAPEDSNASANSPRKRDVTSVRVPNSRTRRRVRRRRRRVRRAKRRSLSPARVSGSMRLCQRCVNQRFRTAKNHDSIGMMGDSAAGCNMRDFQSIGRTCATFCNSRFLWYCRASLKATTGACKEWVKEKSLLKSYKASMSAKAIQQCLSTWSQ